jgi:hypothetical protein
MEVRRCGNHDGVVRGAKCLLETLKVLVDSITIGNLSPQRIVDLADRDVSPAGRLKAPYVPLPDGADANDED